jgi:surfactin synthase thioesterase subunit
VNEKSPLTLQPLQSILFMPLNSIPQVPSSTDISVRLVCIPYAGGGTAVYYRWHSKLPAWIDLRPLSLPGHDGRLDESPCTDLQQIVTLLANELPPLDRPYVLLGHSMGAWLAFELARELRRRSAPRPDLIVVAACPAPHVARTESQLHELPDDELLQAVERRYGDLPSKASASPELMQLLLPALRADLHIAETYRCADEPPLDTEILVIGGTEDPAVSPAQLNGWRQHTTNVCSVRLSPGGHFFLFEHPPRTDSAGTSARQEMSPALRIIVTRIEQRLSTQTLRGIAD